MPGDQAVRGVSNPFVNRILVAREDSPRYGDGARQKLKTFDLILTGEETSENPADDAAILSAGTEGETDSEQNLAQRFGAQAAAPAAATRSDAAATSASTLSSRVYQGSLGIFRQFSEQHPELHGTDLLNAFISELRSILAGSSNQQLSGLSDDELSSVSSSVDEVLKSVRTSYQRKLAAEQPMNRKVNLFA
jgi:hypothetical protein